MKSLGQLVNTTFLPKNVPNILLDYLTVYRINFNEINFHVCQDPWCCM